jgi:starch-binding outer membrane protein, SusD/RagB family
MKFSKIYVWLLIPALLGSCKKFLDFVPDNVATIDNAFAMRSSAEKYLFTCYSFMPLHGNIDQNPAFCGGDEIMIPIEMLGVDVIPNDKLARGLQNVVDPYVNYWDGTQNGKALYRGLSTCNIFLENIGRVPDIQELERKRWIAEVKFLKAYYHYWLMRMYGPIPLAKENIPVTSEAAAFRVKRAPVDSCVNYIVQLLDEAIVDLPLRVFSETSELGRATLPIAMAVKADVLVTAASPLYNGNTEFAGFKNKDSDGKAGEVLFNQTYDVAKWQRAAIACKEAIDKCHEAGHKLYKFNPVVNQYNLTQETLTQMSIRNAVTEKWNEEVIWGNSLSYTRALQSFSQARIDPTRLANFSFKGFLAPTLKMAELFYTNNGVPIEEDNTWDYNNRFNLQTATESDRFHLKQGYTTVKLHFDREPRFYADLAFDGGTWYGQGKFDDKDQFFVSAKSLQPAGGSGGERYSGTGYWPKKLVNFNNVIGPTNTYDVKDYPFPVIRLADLYLLYAEALNEQSGPTADVYTYMNLVRARAGLNSVEESWANYSRFPTKHTTKEGLRSIIHQERLIELAFEGKRYWDLRRWKRAPQIMNKSIQGWDIGQSDENLYYRVRTLFVQQFQMKDYFWPIKESELIINKNLVQTPGW